MAGVLGQQHDPDLVHVRRQPPRVAISPPRVSTATPATHSSPRGSWVSYTPSIRMTGAPIVSVSWLASHRTVSSRPPLAHRAEQQPPLPLGQARPDQRKGHCQHRIEVPSRPTATANPGKVAKRGP